ncbi:MAG: sialidase family protein, partial [Bacillota bacterium]|nr:sialidase family protein [Bacillota bacterium]
TGDRFHASLAGGPIQCARSRDGGLTWSVIGEVPIRPDTENANYHEPHVIELPSGKLIGMIRYQYSEKVQKFDRLTIFQTESEDGGQTWTEAKPTGAPGSPPHLLRHSSGTVVCVHGYRKGPSYGEWAMLSTDNCQTWEQDIVLRDDGPDGDLGYPASVELADGSILTAYYQKYAAGEHTSLLWTRWTLPD